MDSPACKDENDLVVVEFDDFVKVIQCLLFIYCWVLHCFSSNFLMVIILYKSTNNLTGVE